MESSFKASFEKKTHPDGSVEFVFEESRLNAGVKASGHAANFSVILLLGSCTVTMPVMLIAALKPDNPVLMVIAILLWVVSSFWVLRKIESMLFNKKGRVIVIPGEGLKFFDKQLPFSEIKEIAVMTERSTGRTNGQSYASAYIYATAHGQEIRLTKNISENLGSTLVSEIVGASGGCLS